MPDTDAATISDDLRAEIVETAVTSRASVRAFLPTAVPKETIARILEAASYAPSGSNMQPWKVRVVTGAVKDRLAGREDWSSTALVAAGARLRCGLAGRGSRRGDA